MRSPRFMAALVLVGAVVSQPLPARAEPHVRNGLYAGIGYGGSWAKVELDDNQDSQWSGTLALRAGWALRQDLLVGAEYLRWAKDYAIATLQGDIPYEVRLSGALAAVSYFPGNAGFMLRGGVGAAVADIDVTPPPQFNLAAKSFSSDPGLALLAAAGYEARIATKFALGAELDLVYLGVSGDGLDRAYLYGLSAELNWYW